MDDEDKIFSENFNQEIPTETVKRETGEASKKTKYVSIGTDEKYLNADKIKRTDKKISKRTALVVGFIVIISAIVFIVLLTASLWINSIISSVPVDLNQCHFGVKQEFWWNTCITEEEYKISHGKSVVLTVGKTEGNQSSSTNNGEVPFKGIIGASDQVQVEKTKDVLGYYLITSSGDWYGDYVDFRKLPNKIENSGDMKISFRCFADDFLGTSTYFANFRNNINDYLKVEVYINDVLRDTKETNSNTALILEGTCLEK